MRTTVTIRADERLRRALEQRARAQGKTLSAVVRDILRNALEQRPLARRTGRLRGQLVLNQDETDAWRAALRQRNLARLKTWLVDTGPLVTYLDPRDSLHRSVVNAWDPFTGRLVTSSTVITEAMHFVAASPQGPQQVAAVVAESEMDVYRPDATASASRSSGVDAQVP